MRYFFIALMVLLLDQSTKWLVVHKMDLYESIPVIHDFFYLTSHRNRGAAFGILQDKIWLFILITVVVVAFIIYYLWKLKNESAGMSIAFALILGGAIGNLVDRILKGEVVDFLHFQFGSYQFPIFNIADSSIVIGVALLLILTFFTAEQKESFSEMRDTR